MKKAAILWFLLVWYYLPMLGQVTGDTIFFEDFSSGTATTMPLGWYSVDENSQQNGFVWEWTKVGGTGPTTSGTEYILQSTTSANGWMIIDSDNYEAGAYDAILVSPVVNLSAHSNVELVFQELFKKWGNEASNPYGDNQTFLGYSTDAGQHWMDMELHGNFAVKEETGNPGQMVINLSEELGGESLARIRFRMYGSWDFWWQIDDVAFRVAPANDLSLSNTMISAIVNNGAADVADGYYSQIPLSQVLDFSFLGTVRNNGSVDQHNAGLEVSLSNGVANVFTGLESTPLLQPNDSIELNTDPFFLPTSSATYTASFLAVQDEADEVPANNSANPQAFVVNSNHTYSRARIRSVSVSPELFSGGTDGDFVGTKYYIKNSALVKSISVFIDEGTTPGSVIIGRLFLKTGNLYSLVIDSEEHIISASEIGTWVELPLIPVMAGDDLLSANSYYVAGVECYFGNGDIFIGADNLSPQFYSTSSSLRLGPTWYWINYSPMINLNLDGMVSGPIFNSLPSGAANQASTYSYLIQVSDALGTTGISIVGTQLPSWLTLTNYGNNTALLSGLVPSNAVDFPIIITANNGFSDNQQQFLLKPVGVPAADFVASNLNPKAGETVVLTDMSFFNPTSFSWSISPNTFSYLAGSGSTTKNPAIKFTQAGVYTISHNATNGYGNDNETKNAYITVTPDIVFNTTHIYCAGNSNGGVSASIYGATGVYNWHWSTGANLHYLSGLGQGTYYVTASNSSYTIVESIDIAEVLQLTIIDNVQHATCSECQNGAISSFTYGGNYPYTWLWSTNSTMENISNLTTGIYSLTVTDSKGCKTTGTYTVTYPESVETVGNTRSTQLFQNYPNPFINSTDISFFLGKQSNIRISIYTYNGQEIEEVYSGTLNYGKHILRYERKELPPGVYFYRFFDGELTYSKPLVILSE